jgi:RNA polymerase sigma-70 factor (ECF subfamily)
MANQSKHSLFLSEFSRSQTRLYAFILMIVHNESEADEIFQETSALLWEQFDRFEPGTSFGAWAVSIAKLKVLEYLRQNKKNRTLFKPEMYQELSGLAEPASSDVDHRIKALRTCFQRLDRPCRLLLSLRYQKNLSIKKIARQKGVSAGVMYRKLSKIFSMLRQCVERTMVQWE